MLTRSWIAVLLALTLLSAAPPAARLAAQDGAKPDAGKPAPREAITIQWDGKPLIGLPQITKRLYRLKKSGQWGPDRLPKLCTECIQTGHPRLVMLGHWYLALVAGRNGDVARARGEFLEAARRGYRNITEMAEAEELAELRKDPEIQKVIDEIARTLHERMLRNFRAAVDANLKLAAETPPAVWGAELKTTSGEALIPAGKPSVLVLARTHHDPLEAQIPQLKRLQEKAPLSLILWEYDPQSEHKRQQVADYVASLKKRHEFTAPTGIIGRKEYLSLREVARVHFDRAAKAKERSEDDEPEVFQEALPFLVILDSRGAPVHTCVGVQAAWQVDYLLQKLAELPAAAAPAPAPQEEPQPAPAAPETPAAAPDPGAEKPAPGEAKEPPADTPPAPAPKPAETPDAPAPPVPADDPEKPAESPRPEPPKAPEEPEAPKPDPAPDRPAPPGEPEKPAPPGESKRSPGASTFWV